VFDDDVCRRAAALVALYRERGLTLASAESCTGGLVAGLITSIPGSSDAFERGFVTYSNAAKAECLGVDSGLLLRFGAVSAEVAAAMAEGLLRNSPADVAISITGIAGPAGGSAAKPVGLVYFGLARRGGDAATLEKRFGDRGRAEVRAAAVEVAVDLLFQAAGAP
jgi:nicotinamide-nucleotide amidase